MAAVLPAAKPVVTYALLAINALVFAAMVVTGTSAFEPTGADLLKWGADFGPQTLAGEWWRAFTCMFVHIGAVHLALNCWCLMDLGSVVERVFGRGTFLGLYLLTGLAGSVASLWWHPDIISAGASGAVFGVAGALAAVLFGKKLPLSAEITKAKLNSVVVFIGYNVFYGFTRSGIDNAAHLGGLAAGFLLGMLLPVTVTAAAGPGPEPERSRAPAILAAMAVALAGAFWFVQDTHGGYAEIAQARALVESGKFDAAIPMLKGIVERRPKLADAHFLLGYAYLQEDDNDAAEAAFRRTLELQPNSENAHLNLGVIYLRKEKPDQAIPLLRRAAQGDPSLWQANFNLGLAHVIKGEHQTAIPAFEKAAAVEPRDPDIHTFLGRAYLEIGQPDRAIASLLRSLELKPDPAIYGTLARAYAGKGMEKEAGEAMARQVELLKQQPPPQ